MPETQPAFIHANGIDFAYFEMGDGPLALCLHGYPDTAHTYRFLLPALAEAGYRAVAPFSRGYAPTGFAPDGAYQCGVLGLDANALHEALGGDAEAVLIGHDWGALGTYSAATLNPDRWRRVVAMAVPPGAVTAAGYFSFDQLKLSWYMFFQLNPLADMVLPTDNYEFIARLWADWSPGYDAAGDVENFIAAMQTPENLSAALAYYRHMLNFDQHRVEYTDAQNAALAMPPQPLLYLHGESDGCMSSSLAAATPEHLRADGSRFEMVDEAGHFLHLEQPDRVNSLIVDFLGDAA